MQLSPVWVTPPPPVSTGFRAGQHSPPHPYSFLTWSPPTGLPPLVGKAKKLKLVRTMANILLFAAILLAASPIGINTSPRLLDFEHRSLNSVSDEVPLKEGGKNYGSLRQKTHLLLKPTESCGPKLYFLVIVHSAPSHFRSSTVKNILAVTFRKTSHVKAYKFSDVIL